VRHRSAHKSGPHRIALALDLSPSTVYRVLVRHDLVRLDRLDRASGRIIRRYERTRPGELVHVDVIETGQDPRRGRAQGPRPGHHGRASPQADQDRFRLRPLGRRPLLPPGLQRGPRRREGSDLCRLLAPDPRLVLGPWGRRRAGDDRQRRRLSGPPLQPFGETRVLHRYCRPFWAQTNGKVERFNRTLLEEWAYVRTYFRECDRTRALVHWLHIYNHRRVHTAIEVHQCHAHQPP